MLSIIITAFREEKTIAEVIQNILTPEYSGIGRAEIDSDWELLVTAPDKATRLAALSALKGLGISEKSYKVLRDQGEGKPKALNLCFEQAKGDWLLLADGDVVFEENAVGHLVLEAEEQLEKGVKLGAVSGRPIAEREKNSMLNYWGNLLADAAHHKRNIDLTDEAVGLSTKIVTKRKFFPLSGYIALVKNIGFNLPEDCLVDDAYISYELVNQGYKITYAPEAKVSVKYATNLDDYFKQKKRSTGGFIQLWKYGVVKEETKTRSFWHELEYFWFPLKYAKNIKQLIWSLLLYPARVWLWLQIYWERKILKKDFVKTWVRIESTK